MKTVGMIGCGRMGQVLVEGFVSAGALAARQLLLAPRSRTRTAELAAWHPGLHVADDNREVAERSDCLFLCVRPEDVGPVLEEIAPYLRPGAHVVSVAAGVTLDKLSRATRRKVTRAIPSVTVTTRTAVSLVCHNSLLTADDAEFVRSILGPVSEVMMISEENFPVATNLTSSAPAFVAAACQEIVKAAARNSGLTMDEAEQMVLTTLFGVAKLLHQRGHAYDDVIDQVATRGGITEEGIRVLRGDLPALLDKVFSVTASKTERVARDRPVKESAGGREGRTPVV